MKKQATDKIRIYEYIDEDGNVFWSFTETKTRLEHRKLELVDRVGLQFSRWNFELRRIVRVADSEKLLADLEQTTIIEEKNWGKKPKK